MASFEIVAREDYSDVTYMLEIRHPLMARAARPGRGDVVGLLLLTLLIKAKIRITAFSALGLFLLLLQTLVFLALGGGLVAAGGAALYVLQQRKPAAA